MKKRLNKVIEKTRREGVYRIRDSGDTYYVKKYADHTDCKDYPKLRFYGHIIDVEHYRRSYKGHDFYPAGAVHLNFTDLKRLGVKKLTDTEITLLRDRMLEEYWYEVIF